MSRSLTRIPIDELVENPSRVLNRIVRGKKPVFVEKRGKVLVLLTPMRSRLTARRKTQTADRRAFLDAAGSWKDIDGDKFVADNYSSRKRSARPAVQL